MTFGLLDELLQQDVIEVLEQDLVGQQAHHDGPERDPAGFRNQDAGQITFSFKLNTDTIKRITKDSHTLSAVCNAMDRKLHVTHTQHCTAVYNGQRVALHYMQVQYVDRAAQCVIFVWLQWYEA